jgi:hypothetical protein
MQATEEISLAAETPDTRLFVLRLWRETADGPWRVALRPEGGAPPKVFGNLAQLAAYLKTLEDEQQGEEPVDGLTSA